MKKPVLISAVVLLVVGWIVTVYMLLPFVRAQSSMPEDGVLAVRQQEDDSLLLFWPEDGKADRYLVEILQPSGTEDQPAEVIWSMVSPGGQALLLPELPRDRELTFRVNSVVNYTVFGQEKQRLGNHALEVTGKLDMPAVTELNWTTDPARNSMYVTFQLMPGDYCRIYRVDESGNYDLMQTVSEGSWELFFGEDGPVPVPERGETCCFSFSACRELPGLQLYGRISAECSVERQDLLGRDLNVVLENQGNNMFSLSWDETKGEYYEVQRMEAVDQWETVCRIEQGESRSYTSGSLERFQEFFFRVVAVGGQTMPDSDLAAESQIISFTTRESALYATVWPVKDLEAYFDSSGTTVAATAKVGTAYCVADERNGMFGVRIGDQICYIDSNYCMINLPDYMGDLCSYQITNSRKSLYMVHEFEIPRVTGVVTTGYDSVRQADGSYLVPLLYPTAQKLAAAARDAVSQGYRLKIYDAFRPQSATRQIYSRTAEILDDEIPEKTYTGVRISKLDLPEVEEGEVLTYRQVMTNGTYALNSFLAWGTSRHNLGVALDLTLEELQSGEELKMQSSMHDLSWYSVTGRNNANARMLASIMKNAGFATLSSEWWHFQDDEAKNTLSLQAVWNGVTAEGWKWDETGWRYLDKLGVPVREQTLVIEGQEYVFDENGYLTDSQAAFG